MRRGEGGWGEKGAFKRGRVDIDGSALVTAINTSQLSQLVKLTNQAKLTLTLT